VYELQARQAERESLADVRLIAQFKARRIENWLDERRSDARSLVSSAAFVEPATAVIDGTANVAKREMVRDRLVSVCDAHGYEATGLLDAPGSILVAAGQLQSGRHESATVPSKETNAVGSWKRISKCLLRRR
jgi:hypothetical protein